MAFYGKVILGIVIVLVILARTQLGAFVGGLAMLGVLGLLIWLACRLVYVGEWREQQYWNINLAIFVGFVLLAALTLFLTWANPPNPSSGHCTISRYESC